MEKSLSAIIDSFTAIVTDLGAAIVILAILVSGVLLATAGTSTRRAELGKHGITYAILGALVIALAKTTAAYFLGFK